MGIDPAPFWANLYLYNYEENFISDMIQSDKVRARHFHACMRFIDDLLGLNDGGEFVRSSGEIYPYYLEELNFMELLLKVSKIDLINI